MATNSKYRVIYFIDDMAPTSEQRQTAAYFGPHCVFRNCNFVGEDDNVEECEAVYSDAGGAYIPKQYTRAFPWAVSLLDFYAGKLSIAPKAAAEPEDDAPASGAGDPATFDPFAAVEGRTAGAAPDWNRQG